MELLCKCGYKEWLGEKMPDEMDTLTVGKVYYVEVRPYEPFKYEVIDNFGYGLLLSMEEDSPHYIYNFFHTLQDMRIMKLYIIFK